jgi:hypothetical protein
MIVFNLPANPERIKQKLAEALLISHRPFGQFIRRRR